MPTMSAKEALTIVSNRLAVLLNDGVLFRAEEEELFTALEVLAKAISSK